jgi:hypothetical protein
MNPAEGTRLFAVRSSTANLCGSNVVATRSGHEIRSDNFSFSSHLKMQETKRRRTNHNKNQPNVYMESLLFQVAGEEPVLYPPGYFGTGPQERQSSPTADTTLNNALDEQEPDEFYGNNGDLEADWLGGDANFQDFDIPNDSGRDNSLLYRVYDVFIRTAPDPKASRQFYVMQDFQYGLDQEIVVDHSQFAVVTLLNVLSY